MYEPGTSWAHWVRVNQEKIDRLEERLKERRELMNEALRLRCPKRDSGGSRCTRDAGHEPSFCRWRPLTDLPEPVESPYIWSHWRELDRWDLRESDPPPDAGLPPY